MRYMSELIDNYELDRTDKNLARLEAALMVVGPLLLRGTAYGIADARPVESIEVWRYIRRAESVAIPQGLEV